MAAKLRTYECPKCGYSIEVRSERATVSHTCPSNRSRSTTFKLVE